MMKYYLQLTNLRSHYRLQDDLITWRKLESNELLSTDYLTSDISEIIRLQKINSDIDIVDGKLILYKKEIGSSSKMYYDYKLFAVRSTNPNIESKESLINVIKNGNDNLLNCLILNINGKFEIRNFDTINIHLEDPTIVLRYFSTGPKNGYIGAKAAKDTDYINSLYIRALDSWLYHLQTGFTNDYTDLEDAIEHSESELIVEINSLAN